MFIPRKSQRNIQGAVTVTRYGSPFFSHPPRCVALQKEECMSEHAENAILGAPRPTITVSLKKSPNVEAISTIIAGIGGRYGCRTCGLLGVDVVLKGDPAEAAK
jgi:hypothetical protein